MKEKQTYCSPQTLALALKSEGVICSSINSSVDPTITNPFEDLTEILF